MSSHVWWKKNLREGDLRDGKQLMSKAIVVYESYIFFIWLMSVRKKGLRYLKERVILA